MAVWRLDRDREAATVDRLAHELGTSGGNVRHILHTTQRKVPGCVVRRSFFEAATAADRGRPRTAYGPGHAALVTMPETARILLSAYALERNRPRRGITYRVGIEELIEHAQGQLGCESAFARGRLNWLLQNDYLQQVGDDPSTITTTARLLNERPFLEGLACEVSA